MALIKRPLSAWSKKVMKALIDKNMTINEAGERYNITIHILKLYESWEWCRGSVKAELLLIFIGVKRRVRNGK